MDKDLVSEPLRSNRQLLEREALSVTIFERQAAVAAAANASPLKRALPGDEAARDQHEVH